MDKLKQVLKHQFWILLGVAVILPLVGWFLASSGMAKNFDERQKKLDGQLSALKASASDPNNHWESELKKINTDQELELLKARVGLWEMQQELKVWPSKMSTTDPEQFTSADKGYYRKNYLAFREEVFNQIQPVVEDEEEGRRRGMVAIELDSFPISEAVGSVRRDNPSSQEIEEAQEDLWLANALIQAINYVNRDATSQLDAGIPEVSKLLLLGGNKSGSAPVKKAAPAAAGGSGGLGEQMAAAMKDNLKAGGGMMGGGGMKSGGGGTGDVSTVGSIPDVVFDPVDELGEPGENPARRYVDDKDEFRTRGFYLQLKIDQTRVPELLVVLSNLKWPARVTRVHVADVREEELLSADPGSAGGAGMGMAMSGMPGGGGGSMPAGMMPGMMPGVAGGAAPSGMGGNANAMKSMGEQMASRMKGGAGGPAASGAMLGRAADGSKLGGKAAASGLMGAPGAGAGMMGANDGGASVPRVDALSNPNLVNLALDGWFTIYKKPKPEVLAKVNPPAAPEATPTEASAPGESPADASPADPALAPPAAAGEQEPAGEDAVVIETPADPDDAMAEPGAEPAMEAPATGPADETAPPAAGDTEPPTPQTP